MKQPNIQIKKSNENPDILKERDQFEKLVSSNANQDKIDKIEKHGDKTKALINNIKLLDLKKEKAASKVFKSVKKTKNKKTDDAIDDGPGAKSKGDKLGTQKTIDRKKTDGI